MEVASAIEALGAEALVFTVEGYCSDWHASVISNGSNLEVRFAKGGHDYAEDDFSAWWIRRQPTMRSNLSANSEAAFVETQRLHFLHGLIHLVSAKTKCVDPIDVVVRAQSKVLQLQLAQKNGLTIPRTFCGGDPTLADQWMSETNVELCSKAIEAGRFTADDGQTYGRYTAPFARRPVRELNSLIDCPVTIQEFVPKRVELRSTVIGDKILTAAIDTTSASVEARQDWRHYDWANTVYSSYELPTSVCEQLLGLMNDLHLTFGAVDLIENPQGDVVFLEVNPVGQFLWLEDLTDLPISQTMAEYLVSL